MLDLRLVGVSAALFLATAALTVTGVSRWDVGRKLSVERAAHTQTAADLQVCKSDVMVRDGRIAIANQATAAAKAEGLAREETANRAIEAAVAEVARANRAARIRAFQPAVGQSECDAALALIQRTRSEDAIK